MSSRCAVPAPGVNRTPIGAAASLEPSPAMTLLLVFREAVLLLLLLLPLPLLLLLPPAWAPPPTLAPPTATPCKDVRDVLPAAPVVLPKVSAAAPRPRFPKPAFSLPPKTTTRSKHRWDNDDPPLSSAIAFGVETNRSW